MGVKLSYMGLKLTYMGLKLTYMGFKLKGGRWVGWDRKGEEDDTALWKSAQKFSIENVLWKRKRPTQKT